MKTLNILASFTFILTTFFAVSTAAETNIQGSYSFYPTCNGLGTSMAACKDSTAKITSDNVVRGTLYIGDSGASGIRHKFAYRLSSLNSEQSTFGGEDYFYKNGAIYSKEISQGMVTHGPRQGQINFWQPDSDNNWHYTFSLYRTGSYLSPLPPKISNEAERAPTNAGEIVDFLADMTRIVGGVTSVVNEIDGLLN